MLEICKHIHTTRIEVRYAETDKMGVVHHAVYPVWFEQARLDFFKSAGASYVDIEADGFTGPVLKLEVQYKRATHYGDFVDIESVLERTGVYHFRFKYKLFVEGVLCATGSSLHCFLKDGKPTTELPKQVELFFPKNG
ncbi:thioesterase family protein [uncultured Fibrobacter sp.]|uniref:acyl-CoA thioesterase n=1 Tax=uncultured Fibrobacter sp. TaxID=261512 RepID=UPI0026257B80|nr:thioesterase family protein [uncultured Fibrobacter sp.]